MRDREKIEAAAKRNADQGHGHQWLLLEVLLDIRDQLAAVTETHQFHPTLAPLSVVRVEVIET